jgi:hypothetical protein
MKKVVLALTLAASLVVAPPAPAQGSCLSSVFASCGGIFPGGNYFAQALRGYCEILSLLLCEIGY